MSSVERSVAYDIMADQPFQPLSLEYDLDMLRLATALRPPDFTLDEQWTAHMNTLVAGSSFRFPNRYNPDDPKIINALQMREEVLNEFGWLREGSSLRQAFLARQARNYPHWQRPDYIVQNLRLFHDAAKENMMAIVSQNSEFVFRRPIIMAERLVKSWEVGFDTQKIVEVGPYLFFRGSLDDFEQNVRRKVSAYGQQVLKIAAAREIEEKQAERVARVELSPESHQEMLTAVTVHKNNPDFVMDSVWFDKLNTLIRQGSQAVPNYKGKFKSDELDIYRTEINGVRSEFLKELGLLEQDPALERLQQELERHKSLPAPLKVIEILQLFHGLLGNEALRPLREFPRFVWGNATTIRAKLDTIAELTDPAAYLLKHPKDIDNYEGDKLREKVRRSLVVSRKRQTRIKPKKSRPKVVEEVEEVEELDSSFVPDPHATPKLFSDGLELSQAEMSFQVPGPLSLERDAGWLALAGVFRDAPIDQEFVDRLNTIRQKALIRGNKKIAWNVFFQELGWGELSSNKKSLSLPKAIQNMRLMFAHLGNMVMAPITRNMVRVLERTPSTFADELSAIGGSDMVEEVLSNRTNLLAGNLLKLLEKNNGELPEPGQRSGRKSQERKNKHSSEPPAPADLYLRRPPEGLSFSAASVINPARDRTFDDIHQAFAKAPTERQRVLRGYAAQLPGGIEALIETCPELIDCDERALQDFIELAEDPDITQTVLFRRWRQVAR